MWAMETLFHHRKYILQGFLKCLALLDPKKGGG